MARTINLKRKRRKWVREAIVVLSAVALTTIGIKASDTLLNRTEDSAPDNSRCPQEMVFVSTEDGGFCIDKYEASAGEACPGDNPSSQIESRNNLDTPDCIPVASAQRTPWRNISQNQAALACAKAGKRLPTNKEWLQAALGTPDPEGDWGEDDCQVANNWESQPGLTGSGKNCVSPAGVYDMIGNAWEWIDGTVHDGEYEGRALPEPGYISGVDQDAFPTETDTYDGDPNYYYDYYWIKTSGARGMARGGYWNNNSDAGQYALYVVSQPSFTGVGMGFRCVK